MNTARSLLVALTLSGSVALAAAQIAPAPEPTAQPTAQRPRVGLVLSGGGARGMAHLGVLKVLRELRVPVDCIAGTSMGALVGGATAAGLGPDELIAAIAKIDWEQMLDDDPPRTVVPYRIKSRDDLNLFDLQLGVRGTELLLPTGASSGYKLELFFRTLLERAGNYPNQNFDKLPIPFRAVATDLVAGQAHVFAYGDLVRVMRASMSVPGAFAPTEIGDSLFVDGGLTDNLPVAAAREACADVVIAVNLGTPLLKRSEITNIVGVAMQSINLMTEQNVRASLASLKRTDILIEPGLGEFSSGNFKEALKVTVPIGEAAARTQTQRLAALSVPADEYAAWRERVLARLPAQVPQVAGVDVVTRPDWINPKVIEAQIDTRPSADLRSRAETDFDPRNLDPRLIEVYARGDFDSIGYSMLDRPSGRIALVDGVGKSWGPNYVKFGLGLSRDDYQTTFNAALQHRMTWLTESGTEWRNYLQLGYNNLLSTEIYQPLGFREGAFVQPRLAYEDGRVLYFNEGLFIGQYDVRTLRASLNLGTQNQYGQLSAGVFGGQLKATPSFGIANLFLPVQTYDPRQVGYTALMAYDQLDSLHFPRHGQAISLRTFGTVKSMGSGDQYNKTEAQATIVRSVGDHSFQLSAYGGAALSGTLPAYDPFELGGLLQGSGFNYQELFGESGLYMGRAVYSYRLTSLPPQLGRGIYVGGSAELTRARSGFLADGDSLFRYSASVFVGADTILGPLYLAWGQSVHPDSRGMWYLLLGTRAN